ASFAVSVSAPADKIVMYVVAVPLWSLSTVQLPAPEHAENPTDGEELNCTLAPATGVMLSSLRTRTANGEGACPPTAVPGFAPEIILIVSLGPAPTVRTFVIFDFPPEPESWRSTV